MYLYTCTYREWCAFMTLSFIDVMHCNVFEFECKCNIGSGMSAVLQRTQCVDSHTLAQSLTYINQLNVHSMPSDCTRSCIWMRTHMCMDGYWYAHTHRTMWGVAWTGIGYPGNHIIGGQAWLGLWSCIGIGVGHDCIDLRHQSAVLSRIPYIV